MSSTENRCEVGDLTAYSLLRTLVLNYFGAKFCMWHVQSCVCVCVCACVRVRVRARARARACAHACSVCAMCVCVRVYLGRPTLPALSQAVPNYQSVTNTICQLGRTSLTSG